MRLGERFRGLFGGEPGRPEQEPLSVKNAKDFEELYAAIRAQENIVNSRGEKQDPERIIMVVEDLRKSAEGVDGNPYVSKYNLLNVTRALGIRDKVEELFGSTIGTVKE